jgi:hypothetical protein
MNPIVSPQSGPLNGASGTIPARGTQPALRFGFAQEPADHFATSQSEAGEPEKGIFKKLAAKAKHYGAKAWALTKKYGLPATAVVGGGAIGVLGAPFYVVPPVGVALHIAGGALALYGLWKGYQKWKASDA